MGLWLLDQFHRKWYRLSKFGLTFHPSRNNEATRTSRNFGSPGRACPFFDLFEGDRFLTVPLTTR